MRGQQLLQRLQKRGSHSVNCLVHSFPPSPLRPGAKPLQVGGLNEGNKAGDEERHIAGCGGGETLAHGVPSEEDQEHLGGKKRRLGGGGGHLQTSSRGNKQLFVEGRHVTSPLLPKRCTIQREKQTACCSLHLTSPYTTQRLLTSLRILPHRSRGDWLTSSRLAVPAGESSLATCCSRGMQVSATSAVLWGMLPTLSRAASRARGPSRMPVAVRVPSAEAKAGWAFAGFEACRAPIIFGFSMTQRDG